MKKVKALILGVLITSLVSAQEGRLIADSSKLSYDTTKTTVTIIHLVGMTQKVDTGYIVRTIAPMVFVGSGNVRAATDKIGILATRYYIYPKREELSEENIVFLKIKK